jgi:hypothetical protein
MEKEMNIQMNRYLDSVMMSLNPPMKYTPMKNQPLPERDWRYEFEKVIRWECGNLEITGGVLK